MKPLQKLLVHYKEALERDYCGHPLSSVRDFNFTKATAIRDCCKLIGMTEEVNTKMIDEVKAKLEL